MSDSPPKKKPKYEDSTLDVYYHSEPTLTMEWGDQGITAIYSCGLSEEQVREFCEALIRRLTLKPN